MKIAILAVGQKLPSWANDAVAEFVGRMPKDFRVELREVRAEIRSGQGVDRLRAAEAQRLRAAIPAGSLVVALDERGADWTTAQLASSLGTWRDSARDPAFLIGGPDGLDASLLAEADLRLRLSSMTLPHALARVVLAEQVYRAWSILASHPYHRA